MTIPHGHHDHTHSHGDGHGDDRQHGFNVDSLRNNDLLYTDVYRQVIDWLSIPSGANVIEAGCGAGGVTQLLADAVAPTGGVITAFDESAEMIEATRELIERGANAAAVRYRQGDIN